jgi:hypothetical protein
MKSRPFLALLCFLFSSSLASQELSPEISKVQPRSEGAAQSGRAGAIGNAGDVITQFAPSISDAAMDRSARARLSEMWGDITDVYPFLGDRGLLIEVQIGVLAPSAANPVQTFKLLNVFIKGAGADPARAWAGDLVGTWTTEQSDYPVSREASWFWWIKPSENGWPKKVPTFEEATALNLFDQKSGYASIVTLGITHRSRLLADAHLRRATKLSELESIARAAQANADTEELKAAAARLQKSASDAMYQLNEINEQMKRDVTAAARATEGLMILDGILQIGVAGNKVADALGLLVRMRRALRYQ